MMGSKNPKSSSSVNRFWSGFSKLSSLVRFTRDVFGIVKDAGYSMKDWINNTLENAGEIKGEIKEVKGEIKEVKGEIKEVKGEIKEVKGGTPLL